MGCGVRHPGFCWNSSVTTTITRAHARNIPTHAKHTNTQLHCAVATQAVTEPKYPWFSDMGRPMSWNTPGLISSPSSLTVSVERSRFTPSSSRSQNCPSVAKSTFSTFFSTNFLGLSALSSPMPAAASKSKPTH